MYSRQWKTVEQMRLALNIKKIEFCGENSKDIELTYNMQLPRSLRNVVSI